MLQPQWSSLRGPIERCGGRCLEELSGGNWMTVDALSLTGEVWSMAGRFIRLSRETVAPTSCVLTSVPPRGDRPAVFG